LRADIGAACESGRGGAALTAKTSGLHQTVDAQRPQTPFIAWRTQRLAVLPGWNTMSFDDRRIHSVRGKPDRRRDRSRRE